MFPSIPYRWPLRDMPNVNPDTRARICGIAAELGYYAHKSHRTPSKKLGLISTGAHLKDSYFYVAFQKLFLGMAYEHGYQMMVFDHEYWDLRSAGAASVADGKRDQRCFDPRGHGRNAGG